MGGFSKQRDSMGNILLMHPNQDTAQRLSKLLTDNGYHVFVSAAPVLEAARVREHVPRLVITDSSFTTATGEPLPAWLRRSTRLPVVACCDGSDMLSGVRMLEMGADDYITPQLGNRELIARVNRLAHPVAVKGRA